MRRALPRVVSRPLVGVGVAVLLTAPAAGQQPGRAGDGRLGPVLETIRAEHELPAVAALLLVGDSIVEHAAVGRRALGYPERVTTDDRWHLGSLTKAMTATLAGVLVEQGTIEWTTRVSDVLPQLVGAIRPEYQHVTLRELLSHTAGLPTDVRQTPSWPRLRTDTTPIHEQRVRWSGELMRLAPEGPRGRYHYSNAGYIIAGTMFEELTGESWEALIRRELFVPLGMRDVGFGPPGSRGKRGQPWGHVVGPDSAVRPFEPGPYADNPPALGPAGTAHATLESYARFVAAHLAGARGRDGVVSARTFRILHTPVDSAAQYGLGWGVAERGWGDGRVLNHHGTNTMWYATVWIAPNRNFAVIAATNLGGDGAFHGIDEAVATLIRRFEAWVAR